MCCLSVSQLKISLFSRHHLLHIMARRARQSSLSEHARICSLLNSLTNPNLISKWVYWSLWPVYWIRHSSVLSHSLSGWLAGWLQRGPMRDNRRKENSHTHTQTSKFQTVADGFNSSPSFFHNLSGNLLWASVPSFHALLRWLNAASVHQREEKKSQTALINVVRLTRVAAKTISLHHQFKLKEEGDTGGCTHPKSVYTLSSTDIQGVDTITRTPAIQCNTPAINTACGKPVMFKCSFDFEWGRLGNRACRCLKDSWLTLVILPTQSGRHVDYIWGIIEHFWQPKTPQLYKQ